MNEPLRRATSTLRRLGAALLAPLVAPLMGAAAAEPPLQHGPFEIVLHGQRIGAGGFPNTSGNPFKTQAVSQFELRLAGRTLDLPGRGKRFTQVLRIEGAPQPALLVSAGPIHLLTQADGRLQVQVLGGDMPTLQWLDANAGQPGPVWTIGPALRDLQADTVLRGGRLLLVDRRYVLDVGTLTVKAVEPWILGGLNASTTSAVALSPRASLVAMPATGPVGTQREGQGVLLLDLARGGSRALALGAQEPPRDGGEPEVAWFDRYFEWTTGADGREDLRLRQPPRPWKLRGQLLSFGEAREYRLRRVKPEMARALGQLLQQRFGAQPQTDVDARGAGRYLLPACQHRLRVSIRDDGVGLSADTPTQPPWVRCAGEITQIAAAFDAELAAGRHDAALGP